jgi:hypothetical protein
MILRLVYRNFLSFDEEVQFDMFPNMKRTSLAGHIYPIGDAAAVLKMTAIYGGNGVGKSNMLKGVKFLQQLATQKDFLSAERVEKYTFRLKPDAGVDPMELSTEFVTRAGEAFLYSVAIGRRGITSERLYVSGLGQRPNEMIFDRTATGVTCGLPLSPEVAQIADGWVAQNPFASLLTLNREVQLLKDERIALAQRWFADELLVIGLNSISPALIALYKNDEALKRFTSQLFHAIKLGIDRVKVQTENFEDWLGAHSATDLPVDKIQQLQDGFFSEIVDSSRVTRSISVDDGVRKISQLMFEQWGKAAFKRDMDIEAQSDGTVRLLFLAPAFYAAMREGRTVFIDEIDHSIHPILVRALVQYFSAAATTGQLIFTTHQTCLMNQQFLRTDEIWLVEKHEGATVAYSLNDFKIHHTINIENGYLEGRFGAIPFLGELNFDDSEEA